METIIQVLQHELMGVGGEQISFGDEFVIYCFENRKTGLLVTVSIKSEALPDGLWYKVWFNELVTLSQEINGKLTATCTAL